MRVRRVSGASGIITTAAGNGAYGVLSGGFFGDGGPATRAELSRPQGVAVDEAGNLYIADTQNCAVRKVSAATGLLTTIAGTGARGFGGDDGPATASLLDTPYGVAVDGAGNVYIADTGNRRVRRVSAATGLITTVAGGGVAWDDGAPATLAILTQPAGIAVDSGGNLYIAEAFGIRRVSASTGIITTVAGGQGTTDFGDGGPAVNARLSYPQAVAVDADGNLYIADYSNDRIREVRAATGIITTIAGSGVHGFSGDGGPAVEATVRRPHGVAVDAVGNVYFSDTYNCRVRKVDAVTGIVSTVAGGDIYGFAGDGGLAVNARLYYTYGLAIDAFANIFVADTENDRIRMVTATRGQVVSPRRSGTIVAGTRFVRFMAIGENQYGPFQFGWELGEGRTSRLPSPGMVAFPVPGRSSCCSTLSIRTERRFLPRMHP